MIEDPLTLQVDTRLPEIKFQSAGLVLNAMDSYRWCVQQKEIVGWTYTCNLEDLNFLKGIKKLIIGRRYLWDDPRVRYASNTHVKCYVGKTEALLGSYNLTAPTIEDLCVVIKDKKTIEGLRKQFNQHWASL